MSTAVYLRVSTSGQEFDSQRLVCERWLKSKSLDVPKGAWIKDTGTGANLDRPGFNKLQGMVASGEVDHIVMFSLDRLARSMVSGLFTIDAWQAAGVRLTFVADNLDLDLKSWTGQIFVKIVVALKLAMAEQERERNRERQTPGIEAAKARFERARAMHKEGFSLRQIARVQGFSIESIRIAIERGPGKVGWGGRASGSYKIKDKNRLFRLISQGLSTSEIAKVFECHPATVRRLRRKLKEQGQENGQSPKQSLPKSNENRNPGDKNGE